MAIFTQGLQVVHLSGSALLAGADMMYMKMVGAATFNTVVIIPLQNSQPDFSPVSLFGCGSAFPV